MVGTALGIDRNRSYTREEICLRYGYGLELDPQEKKNRNRFFKKWFLDRGLRAVPVGRTYEVNGEVYYAWSLTHSVDCNEDEI